MAKIKIIAGLAHVDYGHMADIVKEVSDAGADYIHCDAADMHNLKNMQLMGGHQIIEGIRPFTAKPIECHAYFETCDKLFIEKIAAAGADMLILPAENFIGAPLAYIMKYCRDLGLKLGLTIGCFAPLCLVEEAIYYLDRLHIVIHGLNDDNWYWRKSALLLIQNAKRLIAERNPDCELVVDGGVRHDNVIELVEEGVDGIVVSSAIFKYSDGITEGVKTFRKVLDNLESRY
jgi:ribulose-phosphate 3-epimerase